jgi:hypothetical protein
MGARRQAAPAPAATVAASENADVDTDGARRARKRITDRKSQRHHRERQRAYVKELEETVKSLRQSCADVGGGDAAALLAENERLRQRCQKLEAAMAKIKSLSEDVYSSEDHTVLKASGSETSRMEEITDNSGLQQNTSSPSTTGSEPIALQPMHLSHLPDQNGGINSVPLGGTFADSGQNLPVLEIDDALHTMTDMPDYAANTTTSIPMADFARAGTTGQGTQRDTEQDQNAECDQEYDQVYSEELDRCLTGILDGTAMSLDLVPTSLTTKDPLIWRLAGSRTASDSNFRPQLMYPTATAPLYYWDKFIMRIIEEAKTQHAMGLYPTEPASLRSVLSDKSSDVLAARLFHWLTAHGGAPLQVLLSTFWVQYLFLRVCLPGLIANGVLYPKSTDSLPSSMHVETELRFANKLLVARTRHV